ncbi:hypothetical protein [Fretibacter rubidus]|uniref:hypothetical protein n=1 Tax=Fretibacter rubidus TaxID=570162 RepID=UPI00352A7FAA
MTDVTPEFYALLKEFKSLPKKDQKAIIRQMTGRDKALLKTATTETKTLGFADHSNEDHNDKARSDNAVVSEFKFDGLPTWLSTLAKSVINGPVDALESVGVTAAVADILPSCLEVINVGSAVSADLRKEAKTKSFGSILTRIKGDNK